MKVTKHVEQLLRQGRKPKELVELGFPKSVVTRVRRKLRDEKATLQTRVLEVTTQTENHAESLPDSPGKISALWQKLQSMENELQNVDHLVKGLSEVTVLMAGAQELGTYMHEICPYQKDGICILHTWSKEGEIPQGIGEPVAVGNEKPEWRIKPSPFYCAMCTAPLEDRIDDMENKVSDDPLSGARDQIKCKGCGNKGWFAIRIKCTKCGRETYWGWFPKE